MAPGSGSCIALSTAAAVVLALEAASAQVPVVPVANPSFEDGQPGEPPASWGGSITASVAAETAPSTYRSVLDVESPREGKASARLERVEPLGTGAEFGTVAQALDAAPYRGHRVKFTAAVRTTAPPASLVGLWLRVDRRGGQMGFFDNMANRPITSDGWADYTIEGDIAADAERIMLGLLLVGDGTAWIDDVRLVDLGPATIDLSDYFEQALALLKALHINSASADWPAIETRARTSVAAAAGLDEVHGAIRGVIADLGEPHTFLRPRSPISGGEAPEPAIPEHELTDARFGVVRLPGFLGTPDQAARYTASLREGLTGMDAANRVCGWIVDLRENTGGNMWPMLNGLDPLLGSGPFGAFRTPSGQTAQWVRGEEAITATAAGASDRPPFFSLRAGDAPVAVLLGPATASSGEMTAIALAQRARARSFGAPTAGFSTANSMLPLSDGSLLVITTAYARDRTGYEYRGPIAPDELVDEPAVEAAAVRWLEAQKYCGRG